MNNKELANLFYRLDRVFLKKEKYFYKHFQKIYDDLKAEINRRNRAAIYKKCCFFLKNNNENQFSAAARYADAVINKDINYWPGDSFYEISQFDSKTKTPIIVDLVMFWRGR